MLLISGARRPLPELPPARRLSDVTIGRLLVLLAFATAGVGSVVAKGALDAGAVPVTFLGVRLSAAVLVLAVLCGRKAVRLPARRIGQLLALGLGFAAQSLIYFTALERTSVAIAVAVVCTYPLVIILGDTVAKRALPSRHISAGMILALLGLWVVAGRPITRPDEGVLLAFAAAVGYGTYLRLSAGQMRSTTPMVATLWVLTGGLLLVAAAWVLSGQTVPPMGALRLASLHGAFATTIPIVAIYAALRRMPAGHMAALGPLEPVVAAGVAATFLGEALSAGELAGIVMLVVAATMMAEVRPRAGLPRIPIALTPRRPLRPRRAPASALITSGAGRAPSLQRG